MNEQVMHQVRQTVADVLGLSLDEVSADSSSESLAEWDSLAHLNLVLALEEQFDTSFTPDDMTKLVTVVAISDIVSARLSP